jgi:Protein of unknown function (DUF1552)
MAYNPRLVRASRALSRRMFLKALALGLSLPLAIKLSRVATAGPMTPAKRFMVFFMPHGVPVEHYNPQVTEGDWTNFALDQTGVSILGPLQKYQGYVNVYQGFKYEGGATHSGIVNCLSGYSGVDATTARTTVEHVIAHGLGVQPLILGACSHQAYGLDNNGMLFWDTTPVDPQKDPVAVFDSLFGPQQPNPGMAEAQLRSQLLALTAGEIQGLQKELSALTSEQTKLQIHLQAIQALQASGNTGSGTSCTTAPTLPAVEAVRAASAGQPSTPGSANDWFYQEANFRMIFQAQLQLAAQALVCNAASVIGLMPMYATCDFDFSFTQAGDAGAPPAGWSHHLGLSHTTPTAVPAAMYNSPLSVANYSSTTREAFGNAQLWFAQQLDQYLLSVLASTPDPTAPGSMVLDNTLVYWMSEIGDGQDHDTKSTVLYPQVPEYLPLVSIGKCGGAIKSGQIVRYATDRPASDLYTSFAMAMGVSSPSFPDATGPVTEVLS